MEWEQAFAAGHVLAASAGLLVGAATLVMRKGTHAHRVIGTVYWTLLVVVNVAALSLHREDTFGVFHALAVASLVTIAVGLLPMLRGTRSPPIMATHAYCMAWSYAGLVAAGWGQLAAAVGDDAGAWVVSATIGMVLSISGVVIVVRVPSIVHRMVDARALVGPS